MASMSRPTLRDVAALANVSHQTVSRVINADVRVNEPTRDRVLAALRELNYVPNAVARSLTSARTHTLGVVTANVSDYAFGQTVAGAEAEARRRGFYLLVGSVEDASNEAEEEAYLQLLLQRQVEGLILDWPTLERHGGPVLAQAAARVPVVLVAAATDLPGIQSVDIDNRRAGHDATAYLIAQGHRTVATITGPLEWGPAQDRLDGYRDALRAANLEVSSILIRSCSEWGPECGRAATARLLDEAAPFTAIFAQSDLLAAGAIAELRRRKIRIPEDVSIVGFDDIPIAGYLEPPLTTMRQPIRELGELAASILIEAIGLSGQSGDRRTNRHLLDAALILRSSVVPPGAA
jgi:LacI family transcriptional regulator